jgi:hypothetical protein
MSQSQTADNFHAVLAIKNINLFPNESDQVEFSLSKENKVTAQYATYDAKKGYDLRGVRAKSKDGKGYVRLVLSLSGEPRQYFQAALFKNEKKQSDKAPDFRGSITIEKDEEQGDLKLGLSAWVKEGEKSGKYLAIAISEIKEKGAYEKKPQSAKNVNSSSDPFDMDDGESEQAAPAPQQRQAPVSQQRQAPARQAPVAQQQAPARQEPSGVRSMPPRQVPSGQRQAPARTSPPPQRNAPPQRQAVAQAQDDGYSDDPDFDVPF